MSLAGIHRGLAVYGFGGGIPSLFMPYPHAASVIGDPVPAALIDGLARFGREVVTFDPPQSGSSLRPSSLGMDEMLACAEEALTFCGITGPVDVAGHSQGGLAALAFALERPERVRRLILVCSAAAGASYMKAPGALWNRTHPGFRRLALYGPLYWWTRRLAAQKLMSNLIFSLSPANGYERYETVEPGDWLRPAHPRAQWTRIARKLDYRQRLHEIRVPTLVLSGRHDPQMPPCCSEELASAIPGAQLVIFERSGHYPFLEEYAPYWEAVREFLSAAATNAGVCA